MIMKISWFSYPTGSTFLFGLFFILTSQHPAGMVFDILPDQLKPMIVYDLTDIYGCDSVSPCKVPDPFLHVIKGVGDQIMQLPAAEYYGSRSSIGQA